MPAEAGAEHRHEHEDDRGWDEAHLVRTLDGQIGVLLPLRPRAGIEAALAASEVLPVEDDTGGDAGAAVRDQLARRERRRRVVPRRVHGTRNPAGDAVDRVRLAPPAR